MRPILCIILLFLVWPVQSQERISGVTLPATIQAGETRLVLNGGGVRKKFFMSMYVGGLYLQQKSSQAQTIISADQPMAVRLEIVSAMISSENMSEAIREGFIKSTGSKTQGLQARIDEFVAIFDREEIRKGNSFELVYEPGKGVHTYKNGMLQNTIQGLDFKKALLGIWLSDHAADNALKRGMLGN